LVSLLIGFGLGLYIPSCSEKKVDGLTAQKDVPKTLISMETDTIQGLDEKVLLERHAVSKEIAKDDTKQVTAAATLKDDSGTTHISSVIDTKTGESEIVALRSRAEWMSRNELGVGVTGGTLGLGEEIEYRRVFARVWKFYPDVRVNVFRWEAGPRLDSGHRYDAQLSTLLTLRW
jgi:hypothetical protein